MNADQKIRRLLRAEKKFLVFLYIIVSNFYLFFEFFDVDFSIIFFA